MGGEGTIVNKISDKRDRIVIMQVDDEEVEETTKNVEGIKDLLVMVFTY